MNTIVVNNLTKIYKQRQRQPGFVSALKTFFKNDTIYKTAVDNVSFTVEEGDIIGLLGPNGAGKTTVLKILSGILYPTYGNVEVAGYTPHIREDEFKKNIALIVGQKNQMMWDLPAIDTLLWLKEIYDIPKSMFNETVKKLSVIFQAEDLLNLQVRRMSLGQRMKMELIAAMLHSPKVVFLDEPTIGLDVVAQNNLREFVKEYNRQMGATVILTSHNLLDVEALCRKVILINDGKITHNQTLKELTETYNYKTIMLSGLSENINSSILPKGVSIVSKNDIQTLLRVEKNICQDIIKFLWANFTFEDFRVEDVSIQEIIARAFAEKSDVRET
ncbi:MAG: ATP-binding cassette domain-containing protein [Clostridiales bacterium]|nr:ATP-binding cassette domain-containing protein [Clostridiales bacterium]